MVDLRNKPNPGPTKQRAVHLDDDTWQRLYQAGKIAGTDRSKMITKLVQEDLHLPDDPVRLRSALAGQGDLLEKQNG